MSPRLLVDHIPLIVRARLPLSCGLIASGLGDGGDLHGSVREVPGVVLGDVLVVAGGPRSLGLDLHLLANEGLGAPGAVARGVLGTCELCRLAGRERTIPTGTLRTLRSDYRSKSSQVSRPARLGSLFSRPPRPLALCPFAPYPRYSVFLPKHRRASAREGSDRK
jgi:hypothetical protein